MVVALGVLAAACGGSKQLASLGHRGKRKALETCVDADFQATVLGTAVVSMQEYQDIVTVASAVPCSVEGYPTVALAGSQYHTTVIDGGTLGRARPPLLVVVGPGESASFVIQQPQNINNCPGVPLYVGAPGTAPQVLVTNAGSWPTCGSLTVSAFERGDNPLQYLPNES